MKNKKDFERNPVLAAIRQYIKPIEDEDDWDDDWLAGALNSLDEYEECERKEDNFEEDKEYLYYIPSPEEQIENMFDPFITAPYFTEGLHDDDYPF